MQASFDWDAIPVVHKYDPSTSFKAEAKINKNGMRTNHAHIILRAVTCHPGLTALELAARLHMTEYQVRRRLSDLKNAGKITRNGERDGNSLWYPA